MKSGCRCGGNRFLYGDDAFIKVFAESKFSPAFLKFRSSLFKGLHEPPVSAGALRRARNLLSAFSF